MRTLILPLVCWAGLYAEPPGTPVYTLVGGLQCGLRLTSGNTAQAWCFDALGINLLYNGIAVVTASANTGSGQFAFTYSEASVTVNTITMQRSTGIIWNVWMASPGAPVQYQIFGGFCSITPPITGVPFCSPPSTTPIQSGTIQ